MFLWWRNLTQGEPSVDVEIETEKTKQEISELQELMNTVTLARPSTVSKGKFNKWAVSEANRLSAESSRLEQEALESQRQTDRAEYQEATTERSQSIRVQREAATARVQDHKKKMAQRATQTRGELAVKAAANKAQREETLRENVRIAQMHGQEQRERVLESRTEKYESRRQAATEHKQGEADRANEKQQKQQKELEAKRERVASIRAETDPSIARNAKALFQEQREAIAKDVRASVQDWKMEKEYRKIQHLEQSKQIHDYYVKVQEAAIDGKAILREQRKKEADQVRRDIQLISDRKTHMKLTAQAAKREHHDESFESKYVAPQQADVVVTSAFDALGNTHRDELALKEGKPGRAIGKPDWFNFFSNTNGWFT